MSRGMLGEWCGSMDCFVGLAKTGTGVWLSLRGTKQSRVAWCGSLGCFALLAKTGTGDGCLFEQDLDKTCPAISFRSVLSIFERDAVQNYEEYRDILSNFGQVVAKNWQNPTNLLLRDRSIDYLPFTFCSKRSKRIRRS